jgi:hypothetical protein
MKKSIYINNHNLAAFHKEQNSHKTTPMATSIRKRPKGLPKSPYKPTQETRNKTSDRITYIPVAKCPICDITIRVADPVEEQTVVCKECGTKSKLIQHDGKWGLIKVVDEPKFVTQSITQKVRRSKNSTTSDIIMKLISSIVWTTILSLLCVHDLLSAIIVIVIIVSSSLAAFHRKFSVSLLGYACALIIFYFHISNVPIALFFGTLAIGGNLGIFFGKDREDIRISERCQGCGKHVIKGQLEGGFCEECHLLHAAAAAHDRHPAYHHLSRP